MIVVLVLAVVVVIIIVKLCFGLFNIFLLSSSVGFLTGRVGGK